MTVSAGHKTTLTGGHVSLGSWGQLVVSGTSRAALEMSSGHVAELPSSVARNAPTTVFWLDEAHGLLLLIPRVGGEILQVDLREGVVRELEWLVRDEDEDLRFTSVRPGPGGAACALRARDRLPRG
jgi:hypothetical protein